MTTKNTAAQYEVFPQNRPAKIQTAATLADAISIVETELALSHDDDDWRIQERGVSSTMTLDEAKVRAAK